MHRKKSDVSVGTSNLCNNGCTLHSVRKHFVVVAVVLLVKHCHYDVLFY